MKGNHLRLNLHVHTVLSPCAELLMTPGNIIQQAQKKGIDVLAITDHNSAENVEPALKLARGSKVTILPGMEVETAEEVHLLCYFYNLEALLELQQLVYDNLPSQKNEEDFFGPQVIVDNKDQFSKKNDRLLSSAVDCSLEEIVQKVKQLQGVVVPAHIGRVNGLLYQLGFIPPELKKLGVTLYESENQKQAAVYQKQYPQFSFIPNTDIHHLKDLETGFEICLNNKQPELILKYLIDRKERKFIF